METQSLKAAKLTVIESSVETIASKVVDAAFAVHKYFGPGMLESLYEAALCRELEKKALKFVKQQTIPVFYQGILLADGFRADIIVEESILLELKACEKLLPVHRAQTLSYLRLSNLPLGFLINFNVPVIKSGLVRIINDRFASSRLGDE